VFVNEVAQLFFQLVEIGPAGPQDIGGGGIVDHGKQQMLHADELVALAPGVHERHMQAYFKLLGNHQFSSITH
jgi:hypothetical protein